MVSKNCCPRCGSKNIQTIQTTTAKTKGKNYSAGQGCIGWLFLGPLGLLCGLCGQGQKTEITHQYHMICNECDHRFASPSYLREQICELESFSIGKVIALTLSSGIVGVLMLALIFAGIGAYDHLPSGELWAICIGGGLVIAAIFGIMSGIGYKINKNKMALLEDELRTLEEQMRRFQTPGGVSGAQLQHGEWRCTCGRINKAYVSSCACGKTKKMQEESNQWWKCAKCGSSNQPNDLQCVRCGAARNNGQICDPKLYIFCSECGDKNPREAKFCSGCGSPLHKN